MYISRYFTHSDIAHKEPRPWIISIVFREKTSEWLTDFPMHGEPSSFVFHVYLPDLKKKTNKRTNT